MHSQSQIKVSQFTLFLKPSQSSPGKIATNTATCRSKIFDDIAATSTDFLQLH